MSMSLSACLLACFSFTTIIQNCSLSIMAVATNRNRWGNGRHLITGQLGRWLDFRCRYWIYDEAFSFLDPCFEFDFFFVAYGYCSSACLFLLSIRRFFFATMTVAPCLGRRLFFRRFYLTWRISWLRARLLFKMLRPWRLPKPMSSIWTADAPKPHSKWAGGGVPNESTFSSSFD